jgi:hypothetical protein
VIEYGGVLFRKPDFSEQNVDEILAWDKLRMLVKKRESAPPAPLLITQDHHERMAAAASRDENAFGVPQPPRCVTAGRDQK